MCLYPRLIENRKYRANKKNGGKIPPITDQRVRYVAVGCQYCIECRKQKARGWQVRLLEDIKTNTNGKFVTLTLTDEKYAKYAAIVKQQAKDNNESVPPIGYELDNRIATQAVRHFLERWRKEFGKSVRHWLVTELGHQGTENIHLHGILWTDEPKEVIANRWQNGYIWEGKYVNEKTVNYIIKYITKLDQQHKYYVSKILTSSGIGNNYTRTASAKNNKFKGGETREAYKTRTGHTIALPVYWRNKIYSEHEREQLWIQKLDKEERYICGERVDISEGDEEYIKLRQWYRQKNSRLGYGGQENGNRKAYEEARRTIMQETRIQKAMVKQGLVQK